MIKNAKFCIIFNRRDDYPIVTMCKILKCSKSGYYSWLKRQDREDSDDVIADLITDYRRVKTWLLRETGLIINHKALLRIMTKYGLQSEIRRRKKYKFLVVKANKANNIMMDLLSHINSVNEMTWVLLRIP